jgi:hypothetical protein
MSHPDFEDDQTNADEEAQAEYAEWVEAEEAQQAQDDQWWAAWWPEG